MIKGTALALTILIITGGDAVALTLTEGSLWTSFPIPVCFEEPKPDHRQDRALVKKTIEQSWARESAVSFKGWRACSEDSTGIRILMGDAYPSTEARGRHLDGRVAGMKLPILWGLAALSVTLKTPVHEFGHALGFGHEHARPDAPFRDECAVRSTTGKRHIEEDRPLTSFDFDSIMVACAKGATRAFSTGVPKLSAADIYGLISAYGSAPHNVLDADEADDRFGASLAVGDFDGDEVPDVAVGAPGETVDGSPQRRGAVYLFKGDRFRGLRPWTRLVASDAALDNGDVEKVDFGSALAASHLNSDKRADLIVGGLDGTDGKSVTIFKGRPRHPPLFWLHLTAEPSINGDPISRDLWQSSIDALDNKKTNSADFASSVRPFDIEGSSGQIGFGSVSASVDLDRDGHDDLIVGAPAAPSDGVPAGQVFVYRSPDTGYPWRKRPTTFIPWYRFGQAY